MPWDFCDCIAGDAVKLGRELVRGAWSGVRKRAEVPPLRMAYGAAAIVSESDARARWRTLTRREL